VTLAILLLAVMWTSATIYALLAGADFGGGIWDLLAGGSRRGARPRSLIEHSIGPVWEANHVWLIFVLVLMWTVVPPLFGAVASTLYLPLTFVALGVIARGAAFAFRKAVSTLEYRRLFGVVFASSSVVTPFFLGAAAGAVASGRVPPGLARGGAVSSWVNPTSAVAGVFAVAACAFLAAVYLTADARRDGRPDLVVYFRHRALAGGLVVGVVSAVGLVVLHADAQRLYSRLTGGAALALVAAAALAGTVSLALILRRHFLAARVSAAAAVAAVLWAWGVAQYPYLLLPGLTLQAAAAPHGTLVVTTGCVAVGGFILLPSLAWLFLLFQRPAEDRSSAGGAP
jgi:cytochrome bd ubiquinol oxidase subunit II